MGAESLSVCVCVCVCVCVYECMYGCMYVCVSLSLSISLCLSPFVPVSLSARLGAAKKVSDCDVRFSLTEHTGFPAAHRVGSQRRLSPAVPRHILPHTLPRLRQRPPGPFVGMRSACLCRDVVRLCSRNGGVDFLVDQQAADRARRSCRQRRTPRVALILACGCTH